MSDSYVDSTSLEHVMRDDAFRYGVQDFMQHHLPAAMTPFVRGALHNLVFSYYGTSQDNQMQGQILALHDRYNLQGLMDMALLDNIRVNVNTHTARGSLQSSVPNPSTPSQPATPSRRPGNPTPSYDTRQRPLRSNKATPHSGRHAGTGTNLLIKCHPPGLEHIITLAHREKNWVYKCDACEHEIMYRGEFVRHMKERQGRVGFHIVRAVPETDPVWYGLDAEGHEYMGRLVARGDTEERRRQRMGPPCKHR